MGISLLYRIRQSLLALLKLKAWRDSVVKWKEHRLWNKINLGLNPSFKWYWRMDVFAAIRAWDDGKGGESHKGHHGVGFLVLLSGLHSFLVKSV